MYRWVPLQVAESPDEDDFAAERGEAEQTPGFDVHSKVQQNGHYSDFVAVIRYPGRQGGSVAPGCLDAPLHPNNRKGSGAETSCRFL